MMNWIDSLVDRGAAWGAVALTVMLVALLAVVAAVVGAVTLVVWVIDAAGVPFWIVGPLGALALAWLAFFAMFKLEGR